MKTLYLLRHGKSLWKAGTESDFERTLNNRGVTDAKKIGKYLVKNGAKIHSILCSPATRTKQTLEYVLQSLGTDVEVNFEQMLYGAQSNEVIDCIRQTHENVDSLLVVGHNPWIQEVSYRLSPGGIAKDQIAMKFPTCSLCVIKFDSCDWQIGDAESVTSAFVTPSQLKW